VTAAISLFFIVAGILHFVMPYFYLRMIPPPWPFPLVLVYLSGALEIALGALFFLPESRRVAAWGLIALLVAVFPANVHIALHPEIFPHLIPPSIYWARLPLQLVFIVWIWRVARLRPQIF
jgi:uncharacterized membrane protein